MKRRDVFGYRFFFAEDFRLVDFFLAEDFLADFLAEDFLADFFADDFFLAAGMFTSSPHTWLTRPCALGAGAPARSCRPTPRSARPVGVHSSGIRCERGSRRRSALPRATTLPFRGRRSLGRSLGIALGPAMERNGALRLSPEITFL